MKKTKMIYECSRCGAWEVFADEGETSLYCHNRIIRFGEKEATLCGGSPKGKKKGRGGKPPSNFKVCCVEGCGSTDMATYINGKGETLNKKRCRLHDNEYHREHRKKHEAK